jgi:hypothetical protein
MKILLVLMRYVNHLSGYISYFDTEYWLMKRAWKQGVFCLLLSAR